MPEEPFVETTSATPVNAPDLSSSPLSSEQSPNIKAAVDLVDG
jgi:hypothetical protein